MDQWPYSEAEQVGAPSPSACDASHVGDTILGIKGRFGEFESCAAHPHPKAPLAGETHQHPLAAAAQDYANWYGALLHRSAIPRPGDARYGSLPGIVAKPRFGKVFVQLKPYQFDLLASIKYDMMQSKVATTAKTTPGMPAMPGVHQDFSATS
jgi:argininosuccinate synthase